MWLIDEKTGREIAEARRAFPSFSADERRDFESRGPELVAADGDPRNMSRAGAVVEILVEGPLSEKPDIWAWFFGGGNTTYESIVRSLGVAAADPGVKEVVLRINSPGGTVAGLFEALAAIESFRYDSGKKLRVVAARAQSAAYAIAALAGKIEAVTPASAFGSIGTAIDFVVYADAKVISVTNTDSPDKRPDIETPEGQAVIRRELDAFNSLFVDAIARGRGLKVDAVLETFGRGATFVADEAKRRGMIDTLPKTRPQLRAVWASADALPIEQTTTAEAGGAPPEKKKMDIETMRAQHPAVFAAAVAEGVQKERDRVGAHLDMGKATGSAGMKIALESIESGVEFSSRLAAKYQAAGITENAIATRQTETDEAAKAVKDAKVDEPKPKTLMDRAAEAWAADRKGVIGGAR